MWGFTFLPKVEPDDVAAIVDVLLTPDAGWITGQVIGVDGGRPYLRTKV
jgi:NAD(P)-dependent dehydrogenase (short-subunit alcohol dehydrogenase family)